MYINKTIQTFFITLTLAFVAGVTGCNNEKEEPKKETPPANNVEIKKEEQPAFLGSTGKYAVLKLSKNDVLQLFSGGVQKLLISFTDNNDAAAPTRTINAIAQGAMPNNQIVGKSIYLFPENISNPQLWDTTGIQILGTNELSRKQARVALGNVNAINATTAKDLYFYPIKQPGNHIAYVVSKNIIQISIQGQGGIKITTYPEDAGITNPSPPATPCTSCDN